MKRTLYFLSTLVFVLIFTENSFAQVIEAKANVVSTISYDAEQSVNFGNIDPALAPQPSLDPENTSNNDGVNGAGVQLGYLVFSGTPDATVTVSWDTPALSESGGETVTFTPSITTQTGDQTANVGTGGGTLYTEGNPLTLGNTTEGGKVTLFVGGTLGNPSVATLPTGTYTGDVTFTIDYTF